MNVLIIGLGSIAQKHIHVLRELYHEVVIYALRSSGEGKKIDGVVDLFDWDSVTEHNFHFALISSPSSLHLHHIRKLWESKIPLMIEKPLFINTEQIANFKRLTSNGTISYVASNFRFHPLLEFVNHLLNTDVAKINEVNAYCGSYLPNWRPNQDYRLVYSANSEMGGGVNLDLIHEPDYLVFLFGLPKSSNCVNRKVSNLEISSVDSSHILFTYPNFSAQITLNYFRKDSKRTLEIVRDKDTIFVDFIVGTVTDLTTGKILFQNRSLSVYTTYKKQMQYFLNCIASNIEPMNSPKEAIEILQCIL